VRISERVFLPHGGRVPPVHRSVRGCALELLRAALFLPLEIFIWALYLARIVYLVVASWWERSEVLTPSRPHQASAIRSRMKKILAAISA
jgi:hypothetical protein